MNLENTPNERRQSQKTTYYVVLFTSQYEMSQISKSVESKIRSCQDKGQEKNEQLLMGIRVSLRGDKNILELFMVMV